MLPKLVLLVVVAVTGAYPVSKEQSQFLRKVGAALGDLASVVLEMNDPYVLQRLSSKDQATQFLVNFMDADPADSPRREFYAGVDSDPYPETQRRRWPYLSMRDFDAEEEDASEEGAPALDDEASVSGSSSSEQDSVEARALNAPLYHDEDTSSDEMQMEPPKSDEEQSASEASESSEMDEPPEPPMTAVAARLGVLKPAWPQGNLEDASAEVPCSDEDEDDDSSSSSEDDDEFSPVHKSIDGERRLIEQTVEDHLWSLLADVTAKLEFEHSKVVHDSVQLHARKILADVGRDTPAYADAL